MQDLRGKWALVTGASSGFGVDFAGCLAERGADGGAGVAPRSLQRRLAYQMMKN
jgi:NAD(P)-dependent dehydrogenase (short-subunit alcohol dehydrogenase family)